MGNEKFEEAKTSVDDEKHTDKEKWLMDLLNEDINEPRNGWRQSLQSDPKDGFIGKIYQKTLPGNKLNVVRIQATMKDADSRTFRKLGEDMMKYHKRYDTYNNYLDYRVLKNEYDE